MTEPITSKRYGVPPVMSRAGGVSVPLPRSLNGITQATRADSSKGHPLSLMSRRVKVKQRRLHTIHATSTQSDTQPKQTQQHKHHNNPKHHPDQHLWDLQQKRQH